MRIFYLAIFYSAYVLLSTLQAQDNPSPPLSTLSESEILHFQMLIEGDNRFAFDLYQQMKLQPGNFYFSPYSIASGLNMIQIGAKGETAVQLQQAFRYSPSLLLFIGDLNAALQKSSKEDAQVLLVNALWLDSTVSILPSFKQGLLRNFRFILQPIDFAKNLNPSIQKINQWFLQESVGSIRNMVTVQDLSSAVKMVLTVAAQLKGEWAIPFDSKLTQRQPFQIGKHGRVLANMMQQTGMYLLFKGEKCDVAAVPFAQEGGTSRMSFVIILPKPDIPLSELEQLFTWENWREWKKQLKSQRVKLMVPRFRIDRRVDLSNLLRGMGLRVIFGPEADFSGISSEKGLFLNEAFHKSSIRLDEKGANMAVPMRLKPNIPADTETPFEFIADRPFVFMIWDQKTDLILFLGRIASP